MELLAAQGRNLQDSSTLSMVAAPVLGFVFDSGAQGLRPMLGIPGAALLGQPLDLGYSIARAAVSPRQDYVLTVGSDDGSVRLLRVQNGDISIRGLDGAAARPDRIILSPSGRAAALYYRDAGVMQVITGLPDSPSFLMPVDTSDAGGAPGVMALSDDGRAMVAAIGDAGSLVLIGAHGTVSPVAVTGPVTAVAFRPFSHDVLAASGTNQVSLVSAVNGDAQYQVVATKNEGIAGPAGVAFSRDGLRAFVANADTGSIGIFDLAGGAPAFITCHCTPTGLYALNGGAAFRLNDVSTNPLLILDGASATPRVLMVPPDAPSTSAGGMQ